MIWWTWLRRARPVIPFAFDPWWAWHREVVAPSPFARAVMASTRADRVGAAFVSGYQAALEQSLGSTRPAALAVTEAGGQHPRALETTLSGGTVSGDKTFLTLGAQARDLWVVARDGSHAGRPRLVLVRLEAGGPGQTLRPGPTPPFVPEVPHAALHLDRAPAAEVRPGDAWTDVVKPFRTVEDLHVLGALLGQALGAAARDGAPEDWVEDALAAVIALEALAARPPDRSAAHLALAAVWRRAGPLLDALPRTGDDATRWARDRALLELASGARAKRTARAWEAWRG